MTARGTVLELGNDKSGTRDTKELLEFPYRASAPPKNRCTLVSSQKRSSVCSGSLHSILCCPLGEARG